eukprot:CAMPEP_0176192840 /NCGR_PEP_ID=MMETSP0121_2-20121125/5177_1 /TAXON_ID=160619 /ORGANISM="Kryptoperidinium foliaceum, Strain CCMP 1326" /LENGTH=72 /DNA_ID=CAMNT_0017531537 /DNA_START=60 /DNA_END=278 /DNA_ORIENTATION=-
MRPTSPAKPTGRHGGRARRVPNATSAASATRAARATPIGAAIDVIAQPATAAGSAEAMRGRLGLGRALRWFT